MSDFTETQKVEKRLMSATKALHDMVVAVALARQVKEFSGERRKSLLAVFTKQEHGNSFAAAEMLARTNAAYLHGLDKLEEQYKDAEATLAKWTATQSTFEAARSLLSMSKETLRHI